MFKKLFQALRSDSVRPAPAEDPPAKAATAVLDVSDSNFDEQVLAAGQLVVVDFWADWCAPCQIISAYVEFLANEYADRLRIAALDVDENPETASRYNVMGLPTLLLFRAGREVDRIVGVESYAAIKARVERQLSA
ncbi:MAG: thioredoxin [Caldilineaceae bacterium]|nr:thioredoxin [Caldilineaceae bacterium]